MLLLLCIETCTVAVRRVVAEAAVAAFTHCNIQYSMHTLIWFKFRETTTIFVLIISWAFVRAEHRVMFAAFRNSVSTNFD